MQRSPMTATIALLAVLSIGGRPNWERGGVRPRDHLLAVHPNMVQPRRAASCSGSSSSPSSARQQRRCAYSGGTRSRSILAQDFGDAVQLDLDPHYVRIDRPAALEFTADLARHKVEDELRLVQGQVIDEATRKPSVHYRLLEEHPDGTEAVHYLYRGSITIEDADRLERRW